MESSRTPPHDPSAAELVKQVSEQTQRLIRQELALARLEISEKAKHAGIGAGMLAGAALAGLFGVGTLIAMLVLLLATALEPWLAALIVGGALLAIAGILALSGKGQLARATPPAPEQTIESVKADVEEVRAHAHT
ncbi:MAG TPA: phage holin family protein [Solirubrobacteraceae bacterium]|nr:phage holin family protein [Solirubrobacteraceae bacterium]